MKKLVLTSMLMLFGASTLFAQNEKYNPVVSADNLNVLYLGIDNPLSIAVPGITIDKITPKIEGGDAEIIKKKDNKYIVRVKKPSIVEVKIFANIDGKEIDCGVQKFRTKDIPKPIAMIGSSDGGRIAKEILAAQGGLRTVVEGFDFPISFKVSEFMMTFNNGSGFGDAPIVSKSGRFTAEMLTKIQALKSGDKIYIENIRVEGPVGEQPVENPHMIFTIE